MQIAVEGAIIIFLVIVNGFLAMSEIAIVSARRARLQHRAEGGDSGARVALEIAQSPTRFLSTVQVGITLIGILAGAFGGATIAEQLSASLSGLPGIGRYSDAIGLGVVVLVITYLSLIIGELVPKRLGLNNPERIAALIARPMRFLSAIVSPAVHVLTLSTEAVLRVFGMRPSSEPPVTEEEIKLMIRQGTEAGVFDKAEQQMVMNVFRLGEQRIGRLMTPQREIVSLDVNDDQAEIQRHVTTHRYSRYPVRERSIDNVVGLVRAKDLLAACLAGQSVDLKTLLRQPLFVPEKLPALKVLELFKSSGTHLAIVVDEHGSTLGLITHHDLLEAIAGDIPSSDLPEEPYAVQREDGSWLIDGSMDIEDFKELFKLKRLPGEDAGVFQTVGGFIMTYLGHIPSVAEHFEWEGLRFEVVDMDGRRVDEALVVVLPETSEGDDS